MLAFLQPHIIFEDDVFALRAAPCSAEEFELSFNVFLIFGADRPVQRNQCAFARGKSFERRVTFRIALHPARPLGDEEDDRVGLVDHLRPVFPWLVGSGRRGLDIVAERFQEFIDDPHPGHEFMRPVRMTVGALTDQQHSFRSRARGYRDEEKKNDCAEHGGSNDDEMKVIRSSSEESSYCERARIFCAKRFGVRRVPAPLFTRAPSR